VDKKRLRALSEQSTQLDAASGRRVPLLVKIAPDLTHDELSTFATAVHAHGIDGVIATNTTSDHSAVAGSRHGDETGGLSGAPLTRPATQVLRELTRLLDPAIPVIAAGGIMSAADAVERIEAGATLVQLYTGLIYRGPGLVTDVATALAAHG
jgi:dihydroorotate dehydrogenase